MYIAVMRSSTTVHEQSERLATELVRFNSIFIRLAGPAEIGFSDLSIVHTLHTRGPSRLSDLLATERIKQPALSAAVNRLVGDGLVHRSKDPLDGRASILRLTDAGEHLVQSRHQRRVQGLEHLVAQLPKSQLASISDTVALLESLMAVHETSEGAGSNE